MHVLSLVDGDPNLEDACLLFTDNIPGKYIAYTLNTVRIKVACFVSSVDSMYLNTDRHTFNSSLVAKLKEYSSHATSMKFIRPKPSIYR